MCLALQDSTSLLQAQLQASQGREANRQNQRIIAALTSRIPAIEAPEPRDSSETAAEEPESAEPGP
jgi:hypothetical protein